MGKDEISQKQEQNNKQTVNVGTAEHGLISEVMCPVREANGIHGEILQCSFLTSILAFHGTTKPLNCAHYDKKSHKCGSRFNKDKECILFHDPYEEEAKQQVIFADDNDTW